MYVLHMPGQTTVWFYNSIDLYLSFALLLVVHFVVGVVVVFLNHNMIINNVLFLIITEW